MFQLQFYSSLFCKLTEAADFSTIGHRCLLIQLQGLIIWEDSKWIRGYFYWWKISFLNSWQYKELVFSDVAPWIGGSISCLEFLTCCFRRWGYIAARKRFSKISQQTDEILTFGENFLHFEWKLGSFNVVAKTFSKKYKWIKFLHWVQ